MKNLLFNELELSIEVQQAVMDMGFVEATPIQSLSIPHLLNGRDVIGQAQTGTGKTAAFGIPAIEHIDENDRETQVLVLCPTRELAMQVADELEKLVKYKKKIRVTAIYGGQSIDRQIQALKRGVHIVVGTPGRIMDHLDRGTLHLDHANMVVLDEADEMLDMGFREDIEAILQETPEDRQTVFFSATMPKQILDLTKKYQRNPEIIKIQKNALTVDLIDQRWFDIREGSKTELLERLVDLYEPKLCLVFCNTKRKVDELVSQLQAQGFFAEALHGDMRQAMRSQVMAKFRQGIIQILVATDVAARGIDVENVEMVINYDVPLDSEYYIHRIGRTGRAGRSGLAFSFVTAREKSRLRDIEKLIKITVKRDEIPSFKDIEGKKKDKFLNRIRETINEGDFKKYREWVDELIVEGVSSQQIAAALLKMEFHKQPAGEDFATKENKFGKEDRGRFDKGDRGGDRRDRDRDGGKRSKGRRDDDSARLFISLGKKDKIGPKDIVGAIAGEAGLEGSEIGSIDIHDKFSFVNVPSSEAERVLKALKKTNLRGNKFHIEYADKNSERFKSN